jgi:hypothetical protein
MCAADPHVVINALTDDIDYVQGLPRWGIFEIRYPITGTAQGKSTLGQ